MGYFVNNRLEIGGGPMLSFSGARFKDDFGVTTYKNYRQSFGVNFYSRYYLKTEGKLRPYLTGNIMYQRSSGSTTDFAGIKSSYKLNEWRAGAGAGLNWFVSPRAALFSELTYTGKWSGGMGYTSGLNLRVGFQFYFGKKKEKK